MGTDTVKPLVISFALNESNNISVRFTAPGFVKLKDKTPGKGSAPVKLLPVVDTVPKPEIGVESEIIASITPVPRWATIAISRPPLVTGFPVLSCKI